MSHALREIIRRHSKPLEPLPTGRQPVLHPLPGIKAVLFDVYGTLLISASGDVGTATGVSRGDAFSAALDAMNVELRGPGSEGAGRFEAVIRQVHAELRQKGVEFPEVDIVDVWRRTVAALFEDGLIGRALSDEELLKRLAVEYEVRVNPVWPMPGCEQVLRSLSEAGFYLGIISNSQFFTLELFPALFGKSTEQLEFCRELQVYSYQEREAKPSIRLFDKASDTLINTFDITGDEVLYVGNDMLNDVFPARAAGFRTALFAGDARSYRPRNDDLRVDGVSPDLVLTELSQLTQVRRETPTTE